MPLFEDIVHKALASEIRRKILLALGEKELYLTELAKKLKKQPQTIDFHVEILEEIGVIGGEVKKGKKFYFLKNKEILKFLENRRPVPEEFRPRPPHEMVLDAVDKLEKRIESVEGKIDAIYEGLKRTRLIR
ncbi:MAG: winged helix-turn-helix transcriptional regulator [Candidatus Aenigmarchaeota archaeon]|nr:winged helix-turn-helix transcriptional regulator [Candidatus Aenigmarchaeota archaeon]